ncbi:hypothetical protein L1049_018421 [Liquidambar formosana]|uniref:NPH3 domain-containing protein n=1 Tax=Liquidambar formosana TaxID=63359 RepID=A0AAP0WMW3_LIQFO
MYVVEKEREGAELSNKAVSPSHVQIHELLAARSAKVAVLLKQNPRHEDLSYFLQDIPADPATFELVARFCHGFQPSMSAENVVPLSCLAYYLGMTESHSSDNLFKKALTYFQERILPCWNESIKAIRTTESVFQLAVHLGLVDACVDSIIAKVLADPCLLGEPIFKNPTCDDDSEDYENGYRPNARRRLFVLHWQSEDLTTLSLRLYEPIICAMTHRQIPSEYVASSLCHYAKKWVCSSTTGGERMPNYKTNSPRHVIEAVERLLPPEKGLLPCALLFEMLRFAIALESSSDCRNGFEIRIGKQLDQATVKDLLIPSPGYAKELQYDIECVRRILKNFYTNYTSADVSGLITVAKLVEEFLTQVASDIDLKTHTFKSLAEMSISASLGTQRSSDGIYRAIDIYLDKHRYLTESEREEVCQVLDCHKMSREACEHAAQNERLPVRVVVQVLFVGQLHLRGTIMREVQGSDDRLRILAEEEKEEEGEARSGCGEEEVRTEMEKMGSKMMELEKECYTMKRKIERGYCRRMKKEKASMWREMKRKFGCASSTPDCNCQVKKKKVHPWWGL